MFVNSDVLFVVVFCEVVDFVMVCVIEVVDVIGGMFDDCLCEMFCVYYEMLCVDLKNVCVFLFEVLGIMFEIDMLFEGLLEWFVEVIIGILVLYDCDVVFELWWIGVMYGLLWIVWVWVMSDYVVLIDEVVWVVLLFCWLVGFD